MSQVHLWDEASEAREGADSTVDKGQDEASDRRQM